MLCSFGKVKRLNYKLHLLISCCLLVAQAMQLLNKQQPSWEGGYPLPGKKKDLQAVNFSFLPVDPISKATTGMGISIAKLLLTENHELLSDYPPNPNHSWSIPAKASVRKENYLQLPPPAYLPLSLLFSLPSTLPYEAVRNPRFMRLWDCLLCPGKLQLPQSCPSHSCLTTLHSKIAAALLIFFFLSSCFCCC